MLTLYAKAKSENVPTHILSSCWRHFKMAKKLTGKALEKFEAERDVWQEVLDGVREIKAGGGKRTKVEAKSHIVRVRLKSGLSQAQFAAALGVSKRTLEKWEQGRRKPSGAAKQLLKIADRHPEVLIEVAA
jgi:putative transcriptional regulator